MHCFHKKQISKRALTMLFALAVQGCAEFYRVCCDRQLHKINYRLK